MSSSIQSWTLPLVDGPVIGRPRRLEDLQRLEREAWDSGYAAGREAGVSASRNEQCALSDELNARVRRLNDVLDVFARPLQELDAEIYEQLAAVVAAIARQLIRRELKTNPEQIVAVVRETVALLPMSAREIRVFLRPEDAVLVRERLPAPAGEELWSIVEDPTMTRGGCRVSSTNSTIDARIEQRIGAAVAAALGDERSGRSGSP
jgi:flagellar assembly protein FliH